MDQANLRLSAKEAELVANADWILTKNEILQKVKHKLAGLQVLQEAYVALPVNNISPALRSVPAKISRGENYKGLPWLVLDYPRVFGKDDHCAIRCMFWWGNFFSITLQLSGSYKKQYERAIEDAFQVLKNELFFIGVSEDQWEHHFDAGNYISLESLNTTGFNDYIREKSFIKLAKKIPLSQWNEAEAILFNAFSTLINLLR